MVKQTADAIVKMRRCLMLQVRAAAMNRNLREQFSYELPVFKSRLDWLFKPTMPLSALVKLRVPRRSCAACALTSRPAPTRRDHRPNRSHEGASGRSALNLPSRLLQFRRLPDRGNGKPLKELVPKSWLGREDSNLRMAESKSAYVPFHSLSYDPLARSTSLISKQLMLHG